MTVKGAYSPGLIRVPLRLVFDRPEEGDCTPRVVFPDFAVSRSLPAFATTAVELTTDRSGEFGFACGMNMVHGTLVVEDNGSERITIGFDPAQGGVEQLSARAADAGYGLEERGEPGDVRTEDNEAEDRRREIADLARRVTVGAVLSAPVVVAVMAHELFDATPDRQHPAQPHHRRRGDGALLAVGGHQRLRRPAAAGDGHIAARRTPRPDRRAAPHRRAGQRHRHCVRDADRPRPRCRPLDHRGRTFHFCSTGCRDAFPAEPDQYIPSADESHVH